MLKMKGIQKIYRTERVETHALRKLTVSVKQGEFVAVMGASGSGKTTFLNIAGLLENFEHGTYMLDGEDVSGLSDDDGFNGCGNCCWHRCQHDDADRFLHDEQQSDPGKK